MWGAEDPLLIFSIIFSLNICKAILTSSYFLLTISKILFNYYIPSKLFYILKVVANNTEPYHLVPRTRIE